MENTTTKITTLHNLLDYDACKFTNAEVQLKNGLQEWVNTATSMQLKNVLHKYLDFVLVHIQKFDDFFEDEKIDSVSTNNRVMQAFIEETNEKLALCNPVEVKDACLLACVQAIIHFKISMYGSAAAFANSLGMEKAATIFHEALINEKHIDDRLSQLAEFEINSKARAPITISE